MLPKQKRSYMHENADQFFRAHLDENSLSPDRKTVYNYIKKPILEMQKKGVTYFAKFYQFLNKEVRFSHEKVKELVIEIDTVYLKIYFPEKTIKNMNVSDINAIISYAVFVSPTDTFYHILHYIYKVKRTDIGIYEENLKKLIDSVSNQITQSDENNEVYKPESIQGAKVSQIDLNQINEVTSETGADQFVNVNTQTEIVPPEIIQNGKIHLKNFGLLEESTYEKRRSENTQIEDGPSVMLDKGENYSNYFGTLSKYESWRLGIYDPEPFPLKDDYYKY